MNADVAGAARHDGREAGNMPVFNLELAQNAWRRVHERSVGQPQPGGTPGIRHGVFDGDGVGRGVCDGDGRGLGCGVAVRVAAGLADRAGVTTTIVRAGTGVGDTRMTVRDGVGFPRNTVGGRTCPQSPMTRAQSMPLSTPMGYLSISEHNACCVRDARLSARSMVRCCTPP